MANYKIRRKIIQAGSPSMTETTQEAVYFETNGDFIDFYEEGSDNSTPEHVVLRIRATDVESIERTEK